MKSLDKLLNSNVSEIGFNKQNFREIEKINILGITENVEIQKKFDCNAYIVSEIGKKSTKSKGKYINPKDTNVFIKNFDFVIVRDPNESNINLLNYDKPIGIQIEHENIIPELRLTTLDSFDFDLYIYKINKELIFNFEEILKLKDVINSIRSNWFIYSGDNFDSSDDFQYLYDLGFIGIVLDLDKLSTQQFNKIKSKIKKIEEKKNGKI